MNFHFGFHKTLLRLGGMRFGVGAGMKSGTGCVIMAFLGVFYLMWYILIGTLWMMYGVFWLMYGMIRLIFVLPIKGIIKLVKNRNQSEQ